MAATLRALGSLSARVAGSVPAEAPAESWVSASDDEPSPDLAAHLATMLPTTVVARADPAAREQGPAARLGGLEEARHAEAAAETAAVVLPLAEPTPPEPEQRSLQSGSSLAEVPATVSADAVGASAGPAGASPPRDEESVVSDRSAGLDERLRAEVGAETAMIALPIAEATPRAMEEISFRANGPSSANKPAAGSAGAFGPLSEPAGDEVPRLSEELTVTDTSPVVLQLAEAPKETRLKRSPARRVKTEDDREAAALEEALPEVNGPAVDATTHSALPGVSSLEETPQRNGSMVADTLAYLQSSLAIAEADAEPVPGAPEEIAEASAKIGDHEVGEAQPDAAVVAETAADTPRLAKSPAFAAAPAVEPAPALAWPQPAASVSQAVAPVTSRISPLAGILIGAAVGAVVSGLATALLLPRLMQSVDLRIAPVADRITKVELRMQQTDASIGRLNSDIAKAIDDGGAIADRVTAQTTELADIQRQIAVRQAASGAEQADSSVFAVAVVQLRSAFYSGRPFEAELVNVFALARGDERFVAPLNVLSGPARSGVPTAGLLRQQLPAFATAAGLRIGQPQSYYEYGISFVGQYLGLATQAYAVESGNEIVTSADRRLMNGNVAGAVDALAGLDPQLLSVFQPWMDAARAYLRVESAVTTMTAAVIESLHQKMAAASAR